MQPKQTSGIIHYAIWQIKTLVTSSQKLTAYFLIILTFILLSVFYFSITSNDGVAGFLTDDAVYLLLAEYFSPWRGHLDNLLQFIRGINHFPPLYPVLMGIFGVDSATPELASHVSISFLLAGFVAIGVWLYIRTGNLIVSYIIPVVIALLPGTIIFSQGLWSEFLFICLLYLSLTIISIDKPSPQHWLAAALFVALLALTRTTGVAMIAAFCLLMLIRRPRFYLLYSFISLAPFLYWFFFADAANTNTAYLTPLFESIAGASAASIIVTFLHKLSVVLYSLLWLFTGTDGSGLGFSISTLFTLLFMTTVSAVFVHRLINIKIDAIFILFYLFVILIWPYFDVYFVSRFLFPVVPIFMFYLWCGISMALRQHQQKYLASAIALACVIFMAVPNTLHFSKLALTSLGNGLDPYRRQRSWLLSNSHDDAVANAKFTRDLLYSLKQIRKLVPANECIYSVHTALVMLYAHRISGELPGPGVSDDVFYKEIHKCGYLVAMRIQDLNSNFPVYYPLRRLSAKYLDSVIPISIDDNKTKPLVYLVKLR